MTVHSALSRAVCQARYVSQTVPLPVLNPLVIQGRGRLRGALGRVVPTSTRQEPSSFELPSRSVPPAFQALQERLSIVSSRLSRL